MKEIFRHKILFWITSFLLIAIAMAGLWQYRSAVSIEAVGVVSADVGPGKQYAPGEEIVTERTENSKKYYLGPDSCALDVSPGAIHYKDDYADENEPWKDIDLTFKNGQITHAPYILAVDTNKRRITVKDKKSGQTSSLRLTGIGAENTVAMTKRAPAISAGQIRWYDVATDLDIAITAENTRVSFDWIVKSENAPHEAEFELEDGGIPIVFKGIDADGKDVDVTAEKTHKIVRERIEKGGSYPKTINPTLDLQVSGSTDDAPAYVSNSVWAIIGMSSSAFYIGCLTPTSAQQYGVGMRFHTVSIPSGSTVTNAYISIKAYNAQSGNTVNSYIIGDKELNPITFSTIADYKDRRLNKRTSAQVAWDALPAWTANTWYNSPNIAGVINEIIGQTGWASGNNVALFWDDHDNRSSNVSGAVRTGMTWDSGSANAPKLHIEYSAVPSISNTPSSYNYGVVAPNSTLSTGLSNFSVTNNSASAVNITVGGTDLTGAGGITWMLSDTATPGPTTCGIKAGLNGDSYNIVVKKTSPYNTLKSGLPAGASQGWGLQIQSPTQFTDTVQKNGTVTLTATVN